MLNLALELFGGLIFRNPEKSRGLAIKFWREGNSTSRRGGLEHAFGIFGLCDGFKRMANGCGSLDRSRHKPSLLFSTSRVLYLLPFEFGNFIL